MSEFNRFRRGSGCYTCSACGKRTRDTGEGANNGLCEKCYEEAGEENAHQDGHHREEPNDGCPLCRKDREEAAKVIPSESTQNGLSALTEAQEARTAINERLVATRQLARTLRLERLSLARRERDAEALVAELTAKYNKSCETVWKIETDLGR